MVRNIYGMMCAAAGLAGMALIVESVIRRGIPPVRGAYLILILTFLTVSITQFLERVRNGGRVHVESHWGGLGGGLSGWRISGALLFLLLSIGLLVLLGLAAGSETPGPDLFERYRSALNLAERKGIKFEQREIVGRKLLLKGTAPSQAVANEFWDQVKLVNPVHDDVVPDLTIQAPAPTTQGGTGTTGLIGAGGAR